MNGCQSAGIKARGPKHEDQSARTTRAAKTDQKHTFSRTTDRQAQAIKHNIVVCGQRG